MKAKRFGLLLLTLVLSTPSAAQVVSRVDLERDIAYIVRTALEIHPAFVEKAKSAALEARARELIQALPHELPKWQSGITVAELLRLANDAHTVTDLSFGSVYYLPLEFAWFSDGLVVAPVTGSRLGVPVASEVLKIGNLGTDMLAQKLRGLVSGSPIWVREVGARSLPAEGILRWLGVVEDDAVRLEVRTPLGDIKTVRVELSGYEFGVSQDL